jgi:hypothetical protein
LFRFTIFDDYGKMKVLGKVAACVFHDDDDPSSGAVRWS